MGFSSFIVSLHAQVYLFGKLHESVTLQWNQCCHPGNISRKLLANKDCCRIVWFLYPHGSKKVRAILDPFSWESNRTSPFATGQSTTFLFCKGALSVKAKILAMKVDQKNIEQSYSSTHPACQVQQAQPFWRQRNTKCGASVTATGMEQRDAHGIIDGTRGFRKGRVNQWKNPSHIATNSKSIP